MSTGVNSLVIPVTDLEAAKATYGVLFGEPHTDTPYYVGYNVDGFEIALAPGQDTTGPVANTDVDDLDATHAALIAAGAKELKAPYTVGPNSRVSLLADGDGNPIGLRGE